MRTRALSDLPLLSKSKPPRNQRRFQGFSLDTQRYAHIFIRRQRKSSIVVNKRELSIYFKAFSDLSRLTIMELLACKDLTVNEITSQVGLTQSAVSRHLSILRAADVVSATRDGQNVIYSLNKENVSVCCSRFCDGLRVTPKMERRKK
ncbi:MAG: winged helix-turn-helix transcriptional regulator [Candidatus Zixiibacteriota bacterium]|nr:MAG: winged helix-turn-helix transcriptional regulator [candidate division Zixibacteria bacterium]